MNRRLPRLAPLVATLAPRIGYAKDDKAATSRYRRANSPSKTWYKSKWWLDTRLRILKRDLWTCQMCGALVAGKGEAHVDHNVPHNDDRQKFFCPDVGLRTLCAHCHNSVKQREERSWA